MSSPSAPQRDPLTGRTGSPPVRSFSIPASLATRLDERARLLGTSPRALCTALLRHYIDHPELYGVNLDADHRPVLHSQATLWNQLQLETAP